MTRAEGADAINLGLADRVVLVTGGVRGVGAGISSVFASQGATVVTCARRAVEGLPYEFHSCDVRDEEAVEGLIGALNCTYTLAFTPTFCVPEGGPMAVTVGRVVLLVVPT